MADKLTSPSSTAAFVCNRPTPIQLQIRRGVTAGQLIITAAGNSSVAFVSTNVPRFLNPGVFASVVVPAAVCYAVIDGAVDGDEVVLWGQ